MNGMENSVKLCRNGNINKKKIDLLKLKMSNCDYFVNNK